MSYPLIRVFRLISTLAVTQAALTAAAPLLQVDFGDRNSPLQTGFSAARASVAHAKGPFVFEYEGFGREDTESGVISVIVAGGPSIEATDSLCARDRGAVLPGGAFPMDNLYRDFITGPSVITIGLAGLKPGKAYEIVFHAFDKNRGQTMNIEPLSAANRRAVVSITYAPSLAVPETISDASLRAKFQTTAPASGPLLFRITSAGGGSAVLNGITITPVGKNPR